MGFAGYMPVSGDGRGRSAAEGGGRSAIEGTGGNRIPMREKRMHNAHNQSGKRGYMDADSGSSHVPDKSPERIISLTQQFSGNGYTAQLHFYCLIVTDKRIICVKTDDLLEARRKEAEENLDCVDRGFRGALEKIFRVPFYSTDFTDHFRKMDPADIITSHPDAEVIPLANLTSFVVKHKFHISAVGSANNLYLDTKIMGRTKNPDRPRVIELYTTHHPDNFPDIDAMQKILGDRFVPPSFSDMLSWS